MLRRRTRRARHRQRASTPVFTGIGHTGDESVADLVAHTRAITPTKLGEEIVALVERLAPATRATSRRSGSATRPTSVLDEATEYVAERRRTMIFAVRDRLRAEERHLGAVRERPARLQSRHLLATSAQRLLEHSPTPRRLRPASGDFAQGWSIVTRRDGRVVTSTRATSAVGDAVRVRVSDGTFRVTVSEKNGVSS